MKIPLPCNFWEKADCNGRELPLKGVSWFKWTKGTEYTYFFETSSDWNPTDFYTTFQDKQPCFMEIPNVLVTDGYIKNKGYPLKGSGYANGIMKIKGNLYINFIMTSRFLLNIKVQCNNNGIYIPGGDIIFPPSYDTEEKRKNALLKSYI